MMGIEKGDTVRIVRCEEATKYLGCHFEVTSDPYDICGSEVVKMRCKEFEKEFSGGFATEFLEVTRKASEQAKKMQPEALHATSYIDVRGNVWVACPDCKNPDCEIGKQVASGHDNRYGCYTGQLKDGVKPRRKGKVYGSY